MADFTEELRDYIGNKGEHYQGVADKLQKEIDSLHKWILASCLTVNSGGLALLFGSNALATRPVFFASGWFLAGIISAIGYAMLQNSLMSRTVSHLRHVTRTFEEFARGNTEDVDRQALLMPLARLENVGRYVDIAQYFSLVFFVIACVIIGTELR